MKSSNQQKSEGVWINVSSLEPGDYLGVAKIGYCLVISVSRSNGFINILYLFPSGVLCSASYRENWQVLCTLVRERTDAG